MDFSSLFCDFSAEEDSSSSSSSSSGEEMSVDDFIEMQLKLQEQEEQAELARQEEQAELARQKEQAELARQKEQAELARQKEQARIKEQAEQARIKEQAELARQKEYEEELTRLAEEQARQEAMIQEDEINREIAEQILYQQYQQEQYQQGYQGNGDCQFIQENKVTDLIYNLPDLTQIFNGTREWQEKYEIQQQQEYELKDAEKKIHQDLEHLYQYLNVPVKRKESNGWFPLPLYGGAKIPDLKR